MYTLESELSVIAPANKRKNRQEDRGERRRIKTIKNRRRRKEKLRNTGKFQRYRDLLSLQRQGEQGEKEVRRERDRGNQHSTKEKRSSCFLKKGKDLKLVCVSIPLKISH